MKSPLLPTTGGRTSEQLVAGANDGDLAALHALWGRFHPLVSKVTARYRGERFQEDLVSETYLHFVALVREHDLSLSVLFAAYLKRKLAGRVYDTARHEWGVTQRELSADNLLDDLADCDPEALGCALIRHATLTAAGGDLAEEVATRLVINMMLDRLPQRERVVVALHCWRGLTHSEIGGQLGITADTCRVVYHPALKRLRGVS